MENVIRKNDVEEFETYLAKQLKDNNVSTEFPKEFVNLTIDDLPKAGYNERKDFRNLNAFTIDSANSKDMDDAISIEKTKEGYILGVHIADVSEYITLNSVLDNLAIERAASIYLPGLTIPMLPNILSQDICSLKPDIDRNTLSVMINLDNNCAVTSYYITKAVIHSKVKGVYSEVNEIINGCADKKVEAKYKIVIPSIMMMRKIAQILQANRISAGASVQNNSEPIIELVDGTIIVTPDERGAAESMIEEFMVLTNNLVAKYMVQNGLPALYRVQRGKNKMAEYMMVKDRHTSLALESYSHFTSPIRRLADLKTHQIISMYLNGVTPCTLAEVFDDETMTYVCEQATKRFRRANNISYTCERFCYARYFNRHRNDRYAGVVSGFDGFNNPIITLDAYNIKVVGKAMLNAYLGRRVTMSVSASSKNVLWAEKFQVAA